MFISTYRDREYLPNKTEIQYAMKHKCISFLKCVKTLTI